MLSVSDAEKLVNAFMTSRLDYCNALLGGCPASSINKLQIVQNAAARVLTRSRKYDHITQILQSLHWLPIKFRISYKILLLAYKALNDYALAWVILIISSRVIPGWNNCYANCLTVSMFLLGITQASVWIQPLNDLR